MREGQRTYEGHPDTPKVVPFLARVTLDHVGLVRSPAETVHFWTGGFGLALGPERGLGLGLLISFFQIIGLSLHIVLQTKL